MTWQAILTFFIMAFLGCISGYLTGESFSEWKIERMKKKISKSYEEYIEYLETKVDELETKEDKSE